MASALSVLQQKEKLTTKVNKIISRKALFIMSKEVKPLLFICALKICYILLKTSHAKALPLVWEQGRQNKPS